MFKRISEGVMHFRWPMMLLLALITMIFGGSIFGLQIDPTVETLFNKDTKAYRQYREFNEKFGSDQMIALAMETPDLFTLKQLLFLKELTSKIESMPQVERVLSLSNVMDVRPKFIGVKVVPALKDVYANHSDDEDIAKARKLILSNELYVNNLVSADGKSANTLIFLKPDSSNKESHGTFLRILTKVLDRAETAKRHFYLAGAPMEQYEFIRLIRHDQFIFVPAITFLLILSTWIIYRNFACMLLAMGIVFMTLIWSMGTISLLGDQLNLVTSLLAPVIMIVAISNTIHVMNLFFEIRGHHESFKESVMKTMSELGVPSLLAHVTTVFGFFSLASSPVPAIRSFGLYAGLGTIYSYIICTLSLPILLSMLPFRPKREAVIKEDMMNAVLVGFIERIQFRGKWWILAATLLLGAFSFVGIQHIKVDTGIVQQLKPDSRLARATRFIDENLTGVYSLGFVFERADGKTMDDPAILKKIDAFKSYLEKDSVIAKVNCVTTLIKKVNQAREGGESGYEIPDDEGRVKLYFEKMMEKNDPELWKMISRDLKQIRLEARMRSVGTQRGAQLEEDALAYLKQNFHPDLKYYLSGNVVLLGHMSKNLVSSQMNGFFYAFVSILAIVTLFFRSLKMGLPVLFVYGIMGYMQIELSTATAMISSIVIGMTVDASIHFMYRFRLEYQTRHNYLEAMHYTLKHVGLSLVISTAVLSIGFCSSMFASFKPTVYLGVFTALSMIFSLICTLLVLPMVLIFTKPFGRQKVFHS